MNELFISYSRKDQVFVRKLHQGFTAIDRDIWVDWEDIPLTADWWEAIQRGIERANDFVFVISPDSVASEVCRKEVDYAIQCRKRLVPILYREVFSRRQVPEAIAQHNWIFFRDQDLFEDAFRALVAAIDTDLLFVSRHTRLLVRTLEWEDKGRKDDYLLRGDDLDEAEDWLTQATAKAPTPTEQQRNYIVKSREAQIAHDRILAAGKKAKQMVRIGSTILGTTLVAAAIIGGLTVQAFRQLEEAKLATQLEREGNTALRQFYTDQLGALLTAVRSGQALQTLVGEQEDLEGYPTRSPFFALQTILNNVREQNRLRADEGNTSVATFSPDGKKLITGSDNGLAQIWSIDGTQLSTLQVHQDTVLDAQFSSNGKVIATASRDGKARLWTPTGRLLSVIEGHKGEIWSITFSPDGQLLATASKDETARLWTLKGEQKAIFQEHQGVVRSVRFSPDGQQLVSVGDDQQVRLWSQTGQQIAAFQGHTATISEVRFSPDGSAVSDS